MIKISIPVSSIIIPNAKAVSLLKKYYFEGKNKQNKAASFHDTSEGLDFVLFDLAMSDIRVDSPGIVDSTVNTERAEENMLDIKLPPVHVVFNGRRGNKTVSVMDGGHRVYINHLKRKKTIKAMMRIDKYDKWLQAN